MAMLLAPHSRYTSLRDSQGIGQLFGYPPLSCDWKLGACGGSAMAQR
jgi:hypothetical protein